MLDTHWGRPQTDLFARGPHISTDRPCGKMLIHLGRYQKCIHLEFDVMSIWYCSYLQIILTTNHAHQPKHKTGSQNFMCILWSCWMLLLVCVWFVSRIICRYEQYQIGMKPNLWWIQFWYLPERINISPQGAFRRDVGSPGEEVSVGLPLCFPN